MIDHPPHSLRECCASDVRRTCDLDQHISALRDVAGDGDDGALADATRLRIRRSLDEDHGIRRQLISAAAALAILLGGTVSWALVTGNLTKLWTAVRQRATITAEQELPTPEPPRAAPVVHAVTPPPMPERVMIEAPVAEPADVTVEPPRAVVPVEVLFRRAHDLHFHGTDYVASLAAWEAYLAAEPTGRFSVEARYNRALCLIRLGRLQEARAALLPFAHDEVEPQGYRHDEATALVERLTD
jgi:hypothetical protein